MSGTASLLYIKTQQAIWQGALGAPGASTFSAHLMIPAFVPDQNTQETVADIKAFELSGAGYSPCILTGIAVSVTNDTCSFTSDPVVFGDPVTVAPFRYLVIAYGAPRALPHKKHLLACLDLSPGGGALEATQGALKVTPPQPGWFTISPPQ